MSHFENARDMLVLTSTYTIHTGLNYGQGVAQFTHKAVPDNTFAFSYQLIENQRLPSPYVTRCRPSPRDHYHSLYCTSDCVNRLTMDKLGLVSFTRAIGINETTMETNRSRILNIYHLTTNSTMNSAFKQISKQCLNRCHQKACHSNTYMTNLFKRGDSRSQSLLEFALKIPSAPIVRIVYQPSFDFGTFVIYVLSCLGIWLGVSMSDINPIKLWFVISGGRRETDHRSDCPQSSRKIRLLLNQNQDFRIILSKMNLSIKILNRNFTHQAAILQHLLNERKIH